MAEWTTRLQERKSWKGQWLERKKRKKRKNRAQSTVKRQVADDFIFSRAALSRLFRWQKADVIIVETRLSFETSCFRRDSTLSYRNFIIQLYCYYFHFQIFLRHVCLRLTLSVVRALHIWFEIFKIINSLTHTLVINSSQNLQILKRTPYWRTIVNEDTTNLIYKKEKSSPKTFTHALKRNLYIYSKILEI